LKPKWKIVEFKAKHPILQYKVRFDQI